MGRKSKRKKFKQASYSALKIPKQAHVERSDSPRADSRSSGGNNGLAVFFIELIRWGAYIALFAPLVVHPSFFFPFVVPKTVFFWIFTEIIFASWLLLAIPNKQFRPKWNPVSIALGIFLLIVVLTSFTGINIERSFWSTFERMSGTINWIHLAIFFFVLTSTFKTLADWKKLVTASFIAANIVSVLFLADRIGIALIPFETRNGATIGNSSFMAAYLLFNVFFGIWLFIKAKTEWPKILYGIGLGLLFLSMTSAYAFGAMVAMFGGLFIVFVCWLFLSAKIKYAKGIAVFLLLAGVLGTGIIAYGTFTQKQTIISKLPYFFSAQGTIGARKVIWEMAWQGVKERPILGWGPENFNVVFAKYFNPCLVLSECGGEVWFDRTHNVVFDHLIHSGVIGLFSYLSLFLGVIWVLWKRIAKEKDWLLFAIITAALASYFVQNLLVFDMPSTYLMFFFTIAFAAGVADINNEGVSRERAMKDPTPFSVVAVGVLAVYFLFSLGTQSLQDAHWGLIINRSRMPYDKQLQLYKKSLSVSPIGNRQVPEFFTNNMVDKLYSNTDIPTNFVEEVAQIMEGVVKKNPVDFRHYLILGNFYAAASGYNSEYLNRAEKFLKKAVELSPKNQQAYTSLGQTYLMRGEEERGILMLKKAMELEARYEKAAFNLADAYTGTARFKEAKELYESLFKRGSIPYDIPRLAKIIRVYEGLKEYDNALAWFREVVESNAGKENGEARFMLAGLYQKAGHNDEARAEALKAKQLDAALSDKVEEFLKTLK